MVSAQCVISQGDFPLNITWLFNGNKIDYTMGFSVGQMNKRISLLSIDSADAVHAGKYTCLAENSAGSDRYSTRLDVNGTI